MPARWSVATLLAPALILTCGGCSAVHSARVIPTSEAPVSALTTDSPPLEIGDPERPTPENPFTSDAVIPCREEEDRAQARKAVESLSADISKLDEASAPSALEKAERNLKAVLDTPCFELAKADFGGTLEFDSALALHTWWWDGGESALLRRVGSDDDDRYPAITLPGEPVPSLLLRGHETHPLAPLLCAAGDDNCGHDTRGWVRRTTKAFEGERRSSDAGECEKNLLNEEPDQRWSALIQCETANAPTRTTLPLGRFRAMTDGYFVITHSPYNSCGSIDVYDLASGTVIKSSSCNRSPPQIGRVPLANLREAAWMMALSAYAADDVRQATTFVIPDRVVPGRTREMPEHPLRHGVTYRRSSMSAAWTWYRRSGSKMIAQVTGTTIGSASYAASRYAGELFRIADSSFVEGCAPAFSSAALASVPWKTPGPMVHAQVELGFDFASPDLDAAREAIPKAKPPAKCIDPL